MLLVNFLCPEVLVGACCSSFMTAGTLTFSSNGRIHPSYVRGRRSKQGSWPNGAPRQKPDAARRQPLTSHEAKARRSAQMEVGLVVPDQAAVNGASGPIPEDGYLQDNTQQAARFGVSEAV